MSKNKYRKEIIEKLLKKYHSREANHVKTNRRVILRPTECYRAYHENYADMEEKQNFDEAVEELLREALITADYVKYSADIEKIYLCEDRLDVLAAILEREYGIAPLKRIQEQIAELLDQYGQGKELTSAYCGRVRAALAGARDCPDAERVRANLKMLAFLEQNEEQLYIREASMLVYGDSKWFEKNNCEEICALAREVLGVSDEEDERSDAVLAFYHIEPSEQEIFIKGNWRLEWDGDVMETGRLKGGIGIFSGDIQRIQRVTVHTRKVLTIENKTSYQRLEDSSFSSMYLGGYANRFQIQFLKMVIRDNPGVEFYHFGDIDVGGFLIHRHLCRATDRAFLLYQMGPEQLKDERFSGSLRPLTDNDLGRMETLAQEDAYRAALEYMKAHNVKLEQEIVSYYLQK